MIQDSVADVISGIEESIDTILMSTNDNLDFLDYLDDDVIGLVEAREHQDSVIGIRQQSFNLLNIQIASKINDVEIGVTEDRAEQLFGGRQLKPIVFEESGIKVEIRPTELPQVKFPYRHLSSPYYAELQLKIEISISGQNKTSLLLTQRFCFKIESDGSIIPIMLMSPRFLKEGGAYNPFLKIPIKKQKSVRKSLIAEIAKTLDSNSTKFDPISLGTILISPNPYGYFIGRRKLVFVSKALPKRKKSEPLLAYITPGYNQSLKIKKNILEKEIRRQVSSRASLHSIQFKNGFIRISTSRSDEKRILHIKVNTWVRMDYRLYLTVSNRTNLLLDARWAEWELKIKARRCWPVCDEVIGIARSLALREIEKNKYFTEHLADLWKHAFRIRSRVSQFGIQLDMKVRL